MNAFLIAAMAVLSVFAVGCQTGTSPNVPNSANIEGNPRLPENALRHAYTHNQWRRIIERPYDAYVILRGKLDDDGKLALGDVIEAWPDDSRNEIARELSRKIRFETLKVGSNIMPTAEVYAVFFEAGLPSVVTVFGRQLDTVGPTNQEDFNPSVYTQFY